MQSVNTLEWLLTAAGPTTVVFGSVLQKVPGWLHSAIDSSGVASLFKRKATREDDDLTSGALDADADDRPVKRSGEELSLVDEMLSQERYALLLRPQIVGNLTSQQLVPTRAAFARDMCLVPQGEVVVDPPSGHEEGDAATVHRTRPLRLEAYYLDRHAVTNAQYQHFVSSGGYEQMAIWDQEIWPAVLDFVDQSGHPGPRFWKSGQFPRGEADHPVVGVSWYEASAYARWLGKRLPTDAEWVKAGVWPVSLPGHPLMQRRYPWGEAMDRSRANLWSSGPGRTVAVDQFPAGVSVGGVQQLIGNVWEWTADPLLIPDPTDRANAVPLAEMKSIRGGAFDTYLDHQATCQFRSGDHALARKHNVGFRCAINLSDLAKTDDLAEPGESEPQETSPVETST